MKSTFTPKQWRIIAGSLVLYTAAYLNRLNLAAALSGIVPDLNITMTQGGLLQTAFAIVYAIGQMVNGVIVDRVNPVRHMMIGILGSGICNLFIGLCVGYEAMVVLCVFNGLFQSMLWTPILRIIALYFTDQRSRETANTLIALTLVLGHLGAWAISGYLSGIVSWRYSFLLPAALVIPASLGGALLFRGIKHDGPDRKAKVKVVHAVSHPANWLKTLTVSGFFIILISCVMFGFVRDGIKTWTPTILNRLSNGNAALATSFSLIIPLINAGGMLIAYWIQHASRINNRRMIAVLLTLGACFCLLLANVQSMLTTALLLGFACACMAGLEPVLTGLVPIEFERENLIGMTAGIIDSLIYVGSALAGVLAGLIYENNGANVLYLCWTIAASIGAIYSLLSGWMMHRYRSRQY